MKISVTPFFQDAGKVSTLGLADTEMVYKVHCAQSPSGARTLRIFR